MCGRKKGREDAGLFKGLDGLPKSDVLKFFLEEGCSVVVRPSGTEPKLKIYISVRAGNQDSAEKTEKLMVEELSELLGNQCPA